MKKLKQGDYVIYDTGIDGKAESTAYRFNQEKK